MTAMIMTLGTALFGFQTAVVSTPPLAGGIVAAIVMSEGAAKLGLPELSVLAIVIYVMQGFAGYPLTAMMLKKEGKRLLAGYRDGSIKAVVKSDAEVAKAEKKLIPATPKAYQTTYILLAKLGLTAWAAVAFAGFLKPYIDISPFVMCLLFGVISREIGFVEERPLNQSGSFGFLITVLMAFVFAGLARTTPQMLGKMIVPMVSIIAMGVVGMGILSMLLGKFLGYTKEMSFAVALTALYGFPPNYILTDEASKSLAANEQEKDFLMQHMLPKMLVGGFTTVTIVSVLMAGIFINFLK